MLERALYNGFLASVALSGDRCRYDNPLHMRDGHGATCGDHGGARTLIRPNSVARTRVG